MPNQENDVSQSGNMCETSKHTVVLPKCFLSWIGNILFPLGCNRETLIGNIRFLKQCFLVYPRLKIILVIWLDLSSDEIKSWLGFKGITNVTYSVCFGFTIFINDYGRHNSKVFLSWWAYKHNMQPTCQE